jgi:hypothetical protein
VEGARAFAQLPTGSQQQQHPPASANKDSEEGVEAMAMTTTIRHSESWSVANGHTMPTIAFWYQSWTQDIAEVVCWRPLGFTASLIMAPTYKNEDKVGEGNERRWYDDSFVSLQGSKARHDARTSK